MTANKRFLNLVDDLFSRRPEPGFVPETSRVAQVLELLGNPQDDFDSIVITGTNGKTSTSRIAFEILNQHLVKVGLFSSPHLVQVNERIQINGELISEEEFLRVWDEIESALDEFETEINDGPPLHFFEILTIIAIMHFYYQEVKVAVFEAGIGGKFDATSAIDSKVCVITNVDFDHQQYLGDTLLKIAKQKAGIIKEDSLVLIGKSEDEEIDQTLYALANERADIVLHEGNDFEVLKRTEAVGGQLLDLRTRHKVYSELPLNLFGEHQSQNALLALCAAEELMIENKETLDLDLVKQAFNSVKVPGRFETLGNDPLVILDVAHNAAGIRSLIETLNSRIDQEKWIGVFSASDDKNIPAFFELVDGEFETIYLTNNLSKRAVESKTLEEIGKDICDDSKLIVEDNFKKALELAMNEAKQNSESNIGVVIFGSVFNAAPAYLELNSK